MYRMSGCSWDVHKVFVYHSDIDSDIIVILIVILIAIS